MRLVPPSLLLAACGTPHFTSEGGQLSIEAPGLLDLETGGADNPVLAGTTFVPKIGLPGGAPEGADIGACFTDSFEGPIAGDRSGLAFLEAGTAVWTFTAVPCAAEDLGFAPVDDRLVVEVVGADDVEGALVATLEEAAEDFVADGTGHGTFPEGWVPAPGEPWRLVAGGTVAVYPRLATVDGGLPVAWQGQGAVVAPEVLEGPVDVVRFENGTAYVQAAAGAEAGLVLAVGGTEVDAGTVVGVDVSEAASMEVAVLYAVGEEGDAPFAARAVVRDAEGNPLFGAPVAWSVDGALAVAPGGEGLPDYVSFSDACLPPSENYGPRTATLRATLGDLAAELDLAWTPRTEPGDDAGWELDPACVVAQVDPLPEDDATACACGTATLPGATLPGLLAALALARRRRYETARAAASVAGRSFISASIAGSTRRSPNTPVPSASATSRPK